MTLAAKSERK